MIQFKSSSEKR